MGNSTFPVQYDLTGGFKAVMKVSATGAFTETSFSVNSTGQLISLGSRKIQTFIGT